MGNEWMNECGAIGVQKNLNYNKVFCYAGNIGVLKLSVLK